MVLSITHPISKMGNIKKSLSGSRFQIAIFGTTPSDHHCCHVTNLEKISQTTCAVQNMDVIKCELWKNAMIFMPSRMISQKEVTKQPTFFDCAFSACCKISWDNIVSVKLIKLDLLRSRAAAAPAPCLFVQGWCPHSSPRSFSSRAWSDLICKGDAKKRSLSGSFLAATMNYKAKPHLANLQ